MIAIEILEAFGDNYIYVVEYNAGLCAVIDPGEVRSVEAVISQRNVELTHILATHHHFDHTGGVKELKKLFDCKVIGPSEVSQADSVIKDGDVIELGTQTVRCIGTPGHTTSSVCYYMPAAKPEAPVLFTGDTLFAFGCGRLFGDDAETMFGSLQKIAELPDETFIYPGHDYTVEDLQFALKFEPHNEAIEKKLEQVRESIRDGLPTVPSTMAEEKQFNPFLKATNWREFADLRRKKDAF